MLIVPDGSLNLLAFSALPVEGSRYLLETGPSAGSDSDEVFRGRRSGCFSFGQRRFDPLPESEREVDDIAVLWTDREGADPE